MSGHHGGHGGHRGHRGGIGFVPTMFLYELDCDPNDPFYADCVRRFSRFGFDPLFPEDLRAIRVYFDTTKVSTSEAQTIKDEFVKWYDNLGPVEVFSQSTLDLARNQRNRFNLANATTPEEKQTVQEVMKTGLTAEQLQGEPDRRNADGMLPGPQKPPPPPLIPTPYLIGGAVVASLALIAGAYGYGRR